MEPRTIEKTSKHWKFLQLIGTLMVVLSLAMTLIWSRAWDNQEEGTILSAMAATMTVLFAMSTAGGLCMYCYARIMTWWHHG
jgi:hypothetical protein